MERQRDEDVEGGSSAKRARIEANIAAAKKRLFSLARDGDLAELQILVNSMNAENGERAKLINSADHAGRTILHIAAGNNDLPMIEWILSDSGGRAAGFNNVLAKTNDGGTALHFAVQRRFFDAFLAIVEGCKVESGERAELLNTVDDKQRTILHLAVKNNDLAMIEWILSDSGGRAAGFNSLLARTDEGRTALHFAVQRRFSEAFLAIVEGCKVENGERAELVNTVDDKQRTILHLAVENNDLAMIEWILSDSGGRAAGFNSLLARTDERRTALHFAVQRGRFDVFLAIVEGCKVENGERAAMLNDVDDRGETMLHYAACFGVEDSVNWLLSQQGREAGFNPEYLFALTKDNRSVLHFAASSSISAECLDHILGQCENTEERCRLLFGDNRGWTLLHYIALNERLSSVEWVVSHLQEERGGSNEDLFALTNNKQSALHLATWRGVVEVFDSLLSRCNNTSERLRLFLGRDYKGWTIFHHAARFNQAGLISHILRKYPDESKMIINARDERGMTVLHRTIIEGLDEDSREEWSNWHNEEDKQAVVASLLGLSYVEVEEGGHPKKDGAAMGNDEEGDDKKPIDAKKVVAIAAGGADPNVGLKFE